MCIFLQSNLLFCLYNENDRSSEKLKFKLEPWFIRKVMEICDTNRMEKMRKIVLKGCMSSLIKRKWSVLQHFMKGAFHFFIASYKKLLETTRTLREDPDPPSFSCSPAVTWSCQDVNCTSESANSSA